MDMENNMFDSAERRCPKCQGIINGNPAFCPECGNPLKKTCSKCGANLEEGQAFCVQCGQRTEANVSQNPTEQINQFNNNVLNQKSNKKQILIGAACIGALILGAFALKGSSKVDFEKTFPEISKLYYCEVASDGSWMKLDTNVYNLDDYMNIEAWYDIEEVNKGLGFSEALMEKMGQTRSIDGRQSDENDKVRVSWTYHPDKGLEVLYERK